MEKILKNDLTENVRETIAKEELIVSGDRVILALSGGPDSVCLFYVLLSLSKEMAFELNAVHVNHMLRGEDSEGDCEYVRNLCRENNITLDVIEVDVNKLAEEKNLTVEEAGRQTRYNAFDKIANNIEVDQGASKYSIKIATAHNLNDQIETLLMRIIRGTGPAGLAGIPLRRVDEEGFEIIRPLLKTDREKIEEFLKQNNIEPRIDKSNSDTKYFRNKIRHKLLPILKEEFGDSTFDSIQRLSRIADEEKDFFDAIVAETIENNCEFIEADLESVTLVEQSDFVRRSGESAVISMELMQGVHPAIRHKLILGIFAELGLNQDIASVHLSAADELIVKGETGKAIDFPRGNTLEIEYENVIFRGAVTIEEYKDAIETRTSTFQSGCRGAIEDDAGIQIAEFDADAIEKAGLIPVWRTRLPGDRIRPDGMDGSKKLQDLFVDMKVPRDRRESLLVLAVDDNILWIPGIRKSRDFAITENTKNVMRFQSRQKLYEK